MVACFDAGGALTKKVSELNFWRVFGGILNQDNHPLDWLHETLNPSALKSNHS